MGYQFDISASQDGTERGQIVPTSILEKDLLSTTSEASIVFTQQGFSANLQTFLINYVISVSSLYSVYS